MVNFEVRKTIQSVCTSACKALQ